MKSGSSIHYVHIILDSDLRMIYFFNSFFTKSANLKFKLNLHICLNSLTNIENNSCKQKSISSYYCPEATDFVVPPAEEQSITNSIKQSECLELILTSVV